MKNCKYDFIIRNVNIFDGTGDNPYCGDIGIIDDKIGCIGDLANMSGNVIDGNGLTLSPGFIDIHTHDDIPIILDPYIPSRIMQGITTSVVCSCGSGIIPFEMAEKHNAQDLNYTKLPVSWKNHKEYVEHFKDEPAAINIILQAGHTTMRRGVIGYDNRKANSKEILSMQKIVEEALSAGAFGMSTGLFYVPGCYADIGEIVQIAEVMSGTKSVYSSHIRDEADNIIDSIREAGEVGCRCNIPVEISHIKCEDRHNWGRAEEVIKEIESLRNNGVNIAMDIYPYTASSTGLSASLRVQHGGRSYDGLNVPAEDLLIVASNLYPEYNGLTLREVAGKIAKPVKLTAEKILEKEDVSIIHLNNMSEKDLETFIKHPLTSIGSDGCHSVSGQPHPRLYGTFPKVISKYSGEKHLFSLETAIHKMTGLTAEKYSLDRRGFIKEGYFADLVLFDPDEIADKATFTDSKVFPEGIKYVFVNGRMAVKNGVQVRTRAGKILKRSDG